MKEPATVPTVTTGATTGLPAFNPADPKLLKDPYPVYAEYRRADPVHWGVPSMADLEGSWYLFRHEENAAVLSDGQTFANDPATVGRADMVPPSFRPVTHVFQRWLGGMDPPDHRRLRAILAKAFTPRRITELRPRIEAITRTLLDAALARDDRVLDVVGDLSFPLPMAVVGDALGVREPDWKTFQAWAGDISRAVDRAGEPSAGAAGAAAIQGMADYFTELVARRRREPTDDLLGAMVASADDDGQPMREFDVIAIATELGVAGHETTANGVAKAMLGLMDQRDRWSELGRLRGRALDEAIEELLRWTCPVQRQRWRWATRDTRVGDRAVAQGDSVVSILGAANRDPAHFPDPDRIDFARNTGRHLTFGFGNHFCLGAHLARLEVRSVLHLLAARFPRMELAVEPEEIEWHNNFILPGPRAVPVRM
jgi:cytochrome P450